MVDYKLSHSALTSSISLVRDATVTAPDTRAATPPLRSITNVVGMAFAGKDLLKPTNIESSIIVGYGMPRFRSSVSVLAQRPELLTSKTPFIGSSVERAGIKLPVNSRDALRDIATEIEWAKVNQIAPEDYLATQRQVRAKVSAEEIAKIYEAYESLKKQERTLDFEDLLLLTTAMIENEPQVREKIHDQYRYFTVDEYQDISPLQQRLIDAWLVS